MSKLIAFLALAYAAIAVATTATAADLQRLKKWNDASEARVDHSAWGRFLQTYVDASGEDGVNRVRYGAVTEEDRKALDGYIKALSAGDPTALGRDEAFAYWANLYNALTVRLILDHYPVDSIRDIKPSPFSIGPWKMAAVIILGEELSLDDIEHGILRAAWKDPRTHYAVNCASIGCPNLQEEPFSGETLGAALDRAARDYINHPRGAEFDARGQLALSSIYKWFREDFGRTDRQVIEHLAKYAEPALAEKLREKQTIDRYRYDWSLNDRP